MEIVNLDLPGIKLIKPTVHYDHRGFFKETYRKSLFEDFGINCEFVQDNHSFSRRGTIRGMHFQRRPGQAKLVSVILGKIYDVVVDMRKDSPTFGKWEGFYLDDAAHHQLFIPVGFAHGFCALSETAHVVYKVSSDYDPQEEIGFRFDDPQINIIWPEKNPIVSDRDLKNPLFQEVV